ncbi:unnamed protein product, partial [Didymodactylos carnosus]
MTIVQSAEDKHLFGGYTNIPWTSNQQTKADTTAFLFTLNNSPNLQSTNHPITVKQSTSAVGHHITYGPIFGLRDDRYLLLDYRYLDADLVMGLEADMRQFCVGFPR